MSEEQRLAASERLAKAREARGHDGSKSVHPLLLEQDDDSPIHWKKVRVWIKEIQSELTSMKAKRLSKDTKERQEYQILEVYLGNLKKFLESSIWLDMRYGRHREGRMKTIVTTMAYFPCGRPKRTVGFYYKDVGVYTEEMKSHDDRIYSTDEHTPSSRELYEQEEVLEDGGTDGEELWT